MTEQELWDFSLRSRVARLAKLVDLNAPSYIIACEVVLVAKAMAGFAPENFAKALAACLQKSARLSMDRCAGCGEALDVRIEDWCRKCMAEAAAEDAVAVCAEYTRPRGVFGGPCLNCGATYEEHKHGE